MAETGIHVLAIIFLHQALEDFFKDRPDVFIASDMFWYWKQGNRNARIAPDVMVVPGVGNHHRRSFFSWKEPAGPAAVFEMASQKTWKKNLTTKLKRYEKLGVKEYFVFDPEDLYLEHPVLGFRLRGTQYRRIRRGVREPVSELGFRLKAEGIMLRLIDAATGQPVLTRAEQVEAAVARADAVQARADAVQARADAEQARADALAAEVERLKKLLGGTNP